MGDPTHIELFGLPGSGKTTVAEQLSTRHAGTVYTLRQGYTSGLHCSVLPERFDPIYNKIPTEMIDWLLYFGIIPMNVQYDQHNYRAYATELTREYTADTQRSTTVSQWINQLQKRYSVTMSNLHCNDIVLLDEGFLQRGNAIFCPPTATKEICYEAVEKYVQTVPTPDLIVLLDISVTESEKRINRRDDGPPRSFSGQNRSELLDRLNRMKLFTEYVRSAAQELSIPISCIENEGPIEDAVAELEAQLKNML